MFVHEDVYDEFMRKLVARTARMVIGDFRDENVDIGPMVTLAHMNRVLEYIRIGRDVDKATLVHGGERVQMAGELGKGYFLSPAIFSDCTDDMTIVREEVFGMV